MIDDCTHVADIDDLAPLCAGCGEIGKGVGRDRSCGVVVEATSSCSEATPTPTVASAEAATASAETTAAVTSAEAATAAEASTATTKAHAGIREAIRTDLEDAALPIVSIELLDGVSSVVWGFEYHNAGTLGPSIGSQVDVGADDTASTGCGFVLVFCQSEVGRT